MGQARIEICSVEESELLLRGLDLALIILSMDQRLYEGLSFRSRPLLKVPIVLAIIFWSCILCIVMSQTMIAEVMFPGEAYIGLLFFLYLFGVGAAYYFSLSIIVDSEGLTIIGPASFSSYGWDEVLGVEVLNPYFPGYEVSTKFGAFGFSGFVFSEHRRLYDVIMAYSRHGDLGS